jgi:hypothetical protein
MRMKSTRTQLLFFTLILLLSFPFGGGAKAQEGDVEENNRAGLVIDLGNGDIVTECVSFSEPQINGYDLLQRSSIPFVGDVVGIGATICSINGVGCDASDCFCACPGGADCVYWSYWHLSNGAWNYSPIGAGGYTLKNGDVDGWVWGPGSITSAIPPISTSFDNICSAVVEPPTPIPTATFTPVPSTATPIPTNTPTSVPPTATSTRIPDSITEFWANDLSIVRGGCTTLNWDVQHVQRVYLDGEGIEGLGSTQVCPIQRQTFTLRAETAGGDITKTVVIDVLEPAGTLTPIPTLLPTATSISTVAPLAVAQAVVNSTATPIPPTETPIPPSVTPQVSDTPVPTAITAPTKEVIIIQLPTVPRATLTPIVQEVSSSPEAIAAVVVTISAVQPTADVGPQTAEWLSYALFTLIATILGGGLFVVRRKA